MPKKNGNGSAELSGRLCWLEGLAIQMLLRELRRLTKKGVQPDEVLGDAVEYFVRHGAPGVPEYFVAQHNESNADSALGVFDPQIGTSLELRIPFAQVLTHELAGIMTGPYAFGVYDTEASSQ
jgi:hypothetical protein